MLIEDATSSLSNDDRINPATDDSASETASIAGAHRDMREPSPVVDSHTDKPCRHKKCDSGYTSGLDERSMYDALLLASKQSYQNEIAALKDEHEDFVKDLQKQLTSMTARKEMLQKWVKKEIVAKEDIQQQFEALQEEHNATLGDLDAKNQEINEKGEEVLVLRCRAGGLTKELFDKETNYQVCLASMDNACKQWNEEKRGLKEEVVALRARSATHANAANHSVAELGVIGEKRGPKAGQGLQTKNSFHAEQGPQAGQWEAWYHHCFGAYQVSQAKLTEAQKAQDSAAAKLNDCDSQREHWWNEAHAAREATCRKDVELADLQQSWEDADTEIKSLRERSHRAECIAANLEVIKENQVRDATAEISIIKTALDKKSAAVEALMDSKAAWKEDSDRILATLSGRVTRDKVFNNLADHAQLIAEDNEILVAKILEQEAEIKGHQEQKSKADKCTLDLFDSVAAKSAEVAQLEGDKRELDIQVASLHWKLEMSNQEIERLEPMVVDLQQQVNEWNTGVQSLITESAASQAQWVINRKDIYIEQLKASLEEADRRLNELRAEHWECEAKLCFKEHGYRLMMHDAGLTDDFRQQVQDLKEKLESLEATAKVRELRKLRQKLAEADMTVEGLRRELPGVATEQDAADNQAAAMKYACQARRAAMHIRELDQKLQLEQTRTGDLQTQLAQGQTKAFEDCEKFLRHVRNQNEETERQNMLVCRLYEHVLKLEATLDAAGKIIAEDDVEGDYLKAECRRYYVEDNSEDHQSVTGHAVSLGQHGDDEHGPMDDNGSDITGDNDLYDAEFEAAFQRNDDQDTDESEDVTIRATRLVAEAFADRPAVVEEDDVNAESRVTANRHESDGDEAEAQEPEFMPDDDGEDVSSIDANVRADESDEVSLPASSSRWAQQHSPFVYGEPIADDQFGHKALLRRRLGKARLCDH